MKIIIVIFHRNKALLRFFLLIREARWPFISNFFYAFSGRKITAPNKQSYFCNCYCFPLTIGKHNGYKVKWFTITWFAVDGFVYLRFVNVYCKNVILLIDESWIRFRINLNIWSRSGRFTSFLFVLVSKIDL